MVGYGTGSTIKGEVERECAYLSEALSGTGLFDPKWYSATYPDVALSGLDPLEHFLRYGRVMGRNPGPGFDRAVYVARNPDVERSGFDPLVHYLKHGIAEGRRATVEDAVRKGDKRVPARDVEVGVVEVPGILGSVDRLGSDGIVGWAVDPAAPGEPVDLQILIDGVCATRVRTSLTRHDVSAAGMQGQNAGFKLPFPRGVLRSGQRVEVIGRDGVPLKGRGGVMLTGGEARGVPPTPVYLVECDEGRVLPVVVVVPVYNAVDAVRDCLESLARTLPAWASVLVIDDASPDPEIPRLLSAWEADDRFTLVRNEENLGYTRTINRGISMSPGADIVLLNSDTVVTPRWLGNMRYCAYAQPETATVTALSDNAGAFSVPVMGQFNPLPDHLSPGQTALAVVRVGEGVGLPVPTGNGFCLYIRRRVLDAIGLFDEERFPRGYGEENDFCMRALHAGWRNVICDKAYVFHKRSQSFQGEKVPLMDAGKKAMLERYPEYRGMIARFGDMEMSLLRGRVGKALVAARPAQLKPRILFVISTQTGGTPQTNLDLMRAMDGRYDCWLLRSDAMTLTLMHLRGGELVPVEKHSLHNEIEPFTHRSIEYDRYVLDMLHRHSIELLHIRHIAWHSLSLPELARSLDIPVICSLHDFYTLCYSVNLLDEGGVYMGTSEAGRRVNPLWLSHKFPDGFVPRWRANMKRFLASCDEFITTAHSAAALVMEVYPELAGRITVIPHGRDFHSLFNMGTVPLHGERLRVLVPGNISDSKGAALIEKMVELDVDKTVEFHFLGHTIGRIKPIGVHHGAYLREEFEHKVREISPHIGVVLSIWPETYCHTLTEMWACGIPVFGIDLGAVGDRIKASNGGWLTEPGSSPEEILARLQGIAANQSDLLDKMQNVRKWQQTEGVWNNTAHMASQYRMLYHRMLSDPSQEAMPQRIGLVVKDLRKGRYPPTAHIRVLGPMAMISGKAEFDTRLVSVEWLLAGGASRLDGVIIQRDAVRSSDVDVLVGVLNASGVRWLYEIDDALWKMSGSHSDHQIDAAQEVAILKLVKGAAIVTCSTTALAEQLTQVGARAVVVPNAHDESLWCAPLDEAYTREVRKVLGLASERPRLLYMGSRSHAEDLDLVMDAVEQLQERFPDLEVVQIGGGRLLPMAREIERPESLFNYPDFVPWFRAVASACTFAISPLRDVEFNLGKSDIKYLDYALARLPGIFSSVGPYRDSVRNGETGWLVANNTRAWLSALCSAVQDEQKRELIREAAFQDARRIQRDGVLDQWLGALRDAFGSRRGIG